MSRGFRGAAILIAILASAGPGRAQNMAFTPPIPSPNLAPSPKAEDPKRPVQHAYGGELPNQRTGPIRTRVVRDICIGCLR